MLEAGEDSGEHIPSEILRALSASETGGDPFHTPEEKVEFIKLYNQWSVEDAFHDSYRIIPRFHVDTSPTTELQMKLRVLSRELHFQRKVRENVENSELENLWKILEEASESKGEGTTASDEKETTKGCLDYHQLIDCRGKVASRCPRFTLFFRPHVILSLPRNEEGKVLINDLFDLVMRQVSTWQLRLSLCSHDSNGRGELTEVDLQEYVREQMKVMPLLETISEDFEETYVVYAARKFFFFHDRHKLRRIKVKDLLLSQVMNEFSELYEEFVPKKYLLSNWFSIEYVTRVHGMYIDLDADANGLLSEKEFRNYGGGSLTDLFVKRLFQACRTYDGEIDYKTYLDFVLAKENPRTKQSIRFFARLLDIDQNGKINRQIIGRFWKSIQDHRHAPAESGALPEVADITNEIFDMVNPADERFITTKELIESGCGHTIASILTDFDGFWEYESRESQPGPDQHSS